MKYLRKKLKQNLKLDYLLIVLVLLLVIFGCVMVHSASSVSAQLHYNDEFFFARKQIIGAVIGLAGMITFSMIDYHKLEKFKWPIFIISLVLLVLVFIPKIGVENYGAKRWVNLGLFTIQPSEIAKFSFILLSSATLSKNYDKVKSIKGIIPVVLAGAVVCLLIIMEPNMSITMLVGFSLLVMLFAGGITFKHFLLILIPVIALVPVLIIIEPYRLKRLIAFLDPWSSPKGEGFQLVQSLYSLGNGGFFGVGIGNSRQKYLFLPFAESDFIFSIIGEETGFLGATLVCLIFLIIILRGIKIALNAKDRFGCLLSTGITSIIAIQFILNVCVVTGSIPPTGLPLPFISAGITSLVVFMSAIGVVLNVNKQSKSRV